MNEQQPKQIDDLQRKISQSKRQARACAVAGNDGDKAIIEKRIEKMEEELRILTESVH